MKQNPCPEQPMDQETATGIVPGSEYLMPHGKGLKDEL